MPHGMDMPLGDSECVRHGRIEKSVHLQKSFLETRGIDPRTSHMLSERSTI